MKVLVAMIPVIACAVLAQPTVSHAQDRWGLLTPAQERSYQACLYAAWVNDYCRANSMDFGACVIGNGGGRYPLEGRRFTQDYCWYTAQGLSPR